MFVTCRWCGCSGEAEDFEFRQDIPADAAGAGFWCPNCDGFTFSNPAEESSRRMLLILESGGAETEVPVPKTGLRKRISPLRYPGGKSRMIDLIYHRLTRGKLDTFVELFAGGASLGLSLLDGGVIKRLVLNELDPLVYSFWDVVLHAPSPLLAWLDSSKPSMSDFFEAKEVLHTARAENMEHTKLILAKSFLLLNRTCFGGILTAGPVCGKNGSQDQLLARWNPKSLRRRIERIHQLADKIQLSNMDAGTFLANDCWWSNNATVFIDPPYVQMGAKLYPQQFTLEDHQDLAYIINDLFVSYPSSDVIITYDDCDFVRALYPHAEVESIPRAYSLTPPKSIAC